MFDKNISGQSKTSKGDSVTLSEQSFAETKLKSSKEQVRKRINSVPSTRYYGSKRKLLNWIYESIENISFTTVLDAFGGTASVSLLFKLMDKELTYKDSLLSNTVCAKALLSNKNPVKHKEFIKLLDAVEECEGFITKNFSGIFYTDDENRWLDSAINSLQTLDNKKRNVFLYCLFQSCLQKRPFNLFHRANLNLRVNQNQQRTFGNLATWNTSFKQLAQRSFLELDSCIWNSGKKHKILEAGDVCELKNGYDLVYLDPPYLSATSKSDNYLHKYHFLEGLVLYEEWLQHIDFSSKCLSFKHNDNIKKWHDKNKFQLLLYELINYHKNSVVVLSYVNGSYPSIDSILKYFKQTFSQTKFFTKEIPKALSKIKREEVLLIGLP